MDIVEEKTISLRKEISIGKGDNPITYSELKLREPTFGEIRKARAMAKSDALDTLHFLIHLVAAVPTSVVESLAQRDMQECGSFFAQFSDSEQSTSSLTEEQS